MPSRVKRLDRDRIVEAALGLMDEHGVDWLTMRRLADALGVSAPTLYWHLPDKDALHDACVERALGEIEIPDADLDDWRAGIGTFMHSMRSQLGRHPSATQLMTRSHPEAVSRIASGAIVLMRAAGLEWDDAFLHCRLMIWRVVGFAGMEHTLRTASELHRPERPSGRAAGIGALPAHRGLAGRTPRRGPGRVDARRPRPDVRDRPRDVRRRCRASPPVTQAKQTARNSSTASMSGWISSRSSTFSMCSDGQYQPRPSRKNSGDPRTPRRRPSA